VDSFRSRWSGTTLHSDLHLQPTAGVGRASLGEMVEAARRRGYAYIAVTDRAKCFPNAKRLREHWETIDDLARKVEGVALLKRVEVEIKEDGTLDLPDDVPTGADWVVACINDGGSQPREQITRRLLGAIRSSHVDAIGRLTGRVIGKYTGYDLELDVILRTAADCGCLLELNSQPDRLDLNDEALMAAKERGVRIIINTDSQSVEELEHMEFGVYQARRAGLQASDVANSLKWAQFQKLLKRKHWHATPAESGSSDLAPQC
jgi:DNA polymerase (family 10)